jgi:hypothetical protein
LNTILDFAAAYSTTNGLFAFDPVLEYNSHWYRSLNRPVLWAAWRREGA